MLGFYRGSATGVLLGGICAGAMLFLGVSGSLFRYISRRFSYSLWRYSHIALTLIAAVTGLLHTFLDGTTIPRLLGY